MGPAKWIKKDKRQLIKGTTTMYIEEWKTNTGQQSLAGCISC